MGPNNLACQNGGTVTGLMGNCECLCTEGYQGMHCESPIPCTAGPNGQACVHGTVTGYFGNCGCRCTYGWEGPICDQPIPCTTGPNGR